jgi:hypothetical protein
MENRYAMIIGINDYEKEPLDFCVNDAKEIKQMLIEKADFREEKIHMILSEVDFPIKDITGKFSKALETISAEFNQECDSIFFYFAGHGYFNGGSHVLFQDSPMNIRSIFESFEPMKPKFQFYVFDSCQSGGKALTRGTNDELIRFSSGAALLYACTETQTASERQEICHGILTNAFLSVMNNQNLYDSDGNITPGRISEEVSKIVSNETEFSQTPTYEARVIGYYPFGHFNKSQENIVGNVVSVIPREDVEENISRELSSVDTVDSIQDTRLKLFKAVVKRIDLETNELVTTIGTAYNSQVFERVNGDNSIKNSNQLIVYLVDNASSFEPLNNCIGKVERKTRKNNFYSAIQLLQLSGNDDSSYIITHIPTIEYIDGTTYNKT